MTFFSLYFEVPAERRLKKGGKSHGPMNIMGLLTRLYYGDGLFKLPGTLLIKKRLPRIHF